MLILSKNNVLPWCNLIGQEKSSVTISSVSMVTVVRESSSSTLSYTNKEGSAGGVKNVLISGPFHEISDWNKTSNYEQRMFGMIRKSIDYKHATIELSSAKFIVKIYFFLNMKIYF